MKKNLVILVLLDKEIKTHVEPKQYAIECLFKRHGPQHALCGELQSSACFTSRAIPTLYVLSRVQF